MDWIGWIWKIRDFYIGRLHIHQVDCELVSSPYTFLLLGKEVQFELEISDFFLFFSTDFIKCTKTLIYSCLVLVKFWFVLSKTILLERIARVTILVKSRIQVKTKFTVNSRVYRHCETEREDTELVSQREDTVPKCFNLACGPSSFLCKLNNLQLMRLGFCQPIIICEPSLSQPIVIVMVWLCFWFSWILSRIHPVEKYISVVLGIVGLTNVT